MAKRIELRAFLRNWAHLAGAAAACAILVLSCSRGLSSVASIKATPDGTTLNLTWGVVSGVSQYIVYLSQSSSVSPSSYSKQYSTDTNSISITGLTLGSTYYLVIVPVALGGLASGPVSSVVKVAINGYVVTSITATASGSTLSLSWSAVSGVAKYVVYLSQSPSVSSTNYTKTYTTTSPTTSLTVNGLAVGTTYYLVIVPTDSSGTATGPASSVVSTDMNGYVYASNDGGTGTLGVLALGSGGGLLPVNGSPFGVTSSPLGIAVSPDNNFVFLVGGGEISTYSVGTDGALTAVGAPPVDVNGPHGLEVTPNGSFLYVANTSSATISGYSIASNGSLATLPLSPYSVNPGSTNPYNLAITPDSSYLYATLNGSNLVQAFRINANGSLTRVSTTSTGSGPWGVAMSPDGKELYVSNQSGSSISAFTIGSGGGLTAVAGSPFTRGGVYKPSGIAVSPDGKYLYTANDGTTSISGYSIGSGGVLSALSGSPFSVGARPVELAVSHDSRYVYTVNSNGTVKAFAIGSGGALTAVSNGSALVGNGGWGIAISH